GTTSSAMRTASGWPRRTGPWSADRTRGRTGERWATEGRPASSVAAGQRLVELEADLREIGPGLDRQSRVGPGADTALEDPHVLEAHLAQIAGHTRARFLVGARAVGDDRTGRVQVQAGHAVGQVLRHHPHRAGDPER